MGANVAQELDRNAPLLSAAVKTLSDESAELVAAPLQVETPDFLESLKGDEKAEADWDRIKRIFKPGNADAVKNYAKELCELCVRKNAYEYGAAGALQTAVEGLADNHCVLHCTSSNIFFYEWSKWKQDSASSEPEGDNGYRGP